MRGVGGRGVRRGVADETGGSAARARGSARASPRHARGTRAACPRSLAAAGCTARSVPAAPRPPSQLAPRPTPNILRPPASPSRSSHAISRRRRSLGTGILCVPDDNDKKWSDRKSFNNCFWMKQKMC